MSETGKENQTPKGEVGTNGDGDGGPRADTRFKVRSSAGCRSPLLLVEGGLRGVCGPSGLWLAQWDDDRTGTHTRCDCSIRTDQK